MLTGKERSFLKSKANGLQAMLQLGKSGITEAFLLELDEALENHELVKISILDSGEKSLKDISYAIVEGSGAEFVSLVGKKVVIYRESGKIEPKDRLHIPKRRL